MRKTPLMLLMLALFCCFAAKATPTGKEAGPVIEKSQPAKSCLSSENQLCNFVPSECRKTAPFDWFLGLIIANDCGDGTINYVLLLTYVDADGNVSLSMMNLTPECGIPAP